MSNTMHTIATEALEKLAQGRPGRAYLRDQIPLWEKRVEEIKQEAEDLEAMITRAKELNEKFRSAKEALAAHDDHAEEPDADEATTDEPEEEPAPEE